METKTYKGSDYEVLWQPGKCMHSTLCWRNLRPVFDPSRKPWIVLENGDRESIRKQVLQCPSGALQWVDLQEVTGQSDQAHHDESIRVEPRSNGPLLVKGNFVLVHPDGKEEVKEKITAFCRCGGSQNKPYCDGTHTKNGFTG